MKTTVTAAGILKPIVYIVDMSSERPPAADSAALFAEAVSIMARLRGPDGCPWDREQSFDTIRKYTLEECYEVLDAIERRHWTDLCEELGDLLLQVIFYAQMANEAGHFSIADVIAGLNRKLVRRHPHVFGEEASMAAGNAVESPLETEDYRLLPGAAQLGCHQAGREDAAGFVGAGQHSAWASSAAGGSQVGVACAKEWLRLARGRRHLR